MDEKTFFEHADVKVTNSRFMVGSQTFALSNITSVKSSENLPNRAGPALVGLVGVLTMFGEAVAFSVLLFAVAAVWWLFQKAKFHVRLTTAAGEATALTSEQREYIKQVVQALNEAIVARG